MSRRKILVGMVLLLLLAMGCDQSTTPTPAAQPSKASGKQETAETTSRSDGPTRSAVHQGPPITEHEALAFGREIEVAIASRDKQAFASLWDWQAFKDEVVADIPGDSQEAKEIRHHALAVASGAISSLGTGLVDQLANGRYELLRVRADSDGTRLLFRLTPASGGLNYHELYLARRSGTVCVVDIYVYISGERMSTTMGRLTIAALSTDKRTMLTKLIGAKNEALRHMDTISDMNAAFKAGNFKRSLELYATLPPKVRSDKAILLIRTLAAAQVNDDEHLAAIDDYRATFPNDPSLDLIAVDGYILRKQWQAAHESLDRLDQSVGGDPYLQYVHATTYFQEGKHDEVLKIAAGMLKTDPHNAEAHGLQVNVALARKDHARTAQLLTKIRDELKIELLDLTKLPEYADFVRSPEYEEWKLSILK